MHLAGTRERSADAKRPDAVRAQAGERVLAERHDEWAEGRRYLGLDILTRARLTAGAGVEEVTTDPFQALTA